jgi:hypothetical protein
MMNFCKGGYSTSKQSGGSLVCLLTKTIEKYEDLLRLEIAPTILSFALGRLEHVTDGKLSKQPQKEEFDRSILPFP